MTDQTTATAAAPGETDATAQIPFVETSTAKKIWQICDAAGTYQIIATIYGESQTGKTKALEEYHRRHPDRTRLIPMPVKATFAQVVRDIAAKLGIGISRHSIERIRKEIIKALNPDMLIIIDELHQPFETYTPEHRIPCIEYIREIYDRVGCGMVLCGTNVARDEINGGPHKRLLAQISRRGVFKLQIPDHATIEDRNAIARHFRLAPAAGEARKLVDYIIRGYGLKAYITYLRAGARLAERRSQPIAWDHVLAAHETIAALSQKGDQHQ